MILKIYPDFFEKTENSIKNFKNERIYWKDSLYDIFRLSYLDKLYREKKFEMPKLTKEQILKCSTFFEHVERWLEYKFQIAKSFYLNPTLGHKKTVKADADLVIDSTLYEIKTVLYPEKYI